MSSEPEPIGSLAPPTDLPAAAADVLRQALRAGAAPQSGDGTLRSALRQLTEQARHRGLRAEQLVVVLKQEWAALPEIRDMPAGRQRSEALARVVSLCIEEYYAPPHTGDAAG